MLLSGCDSWDEINEYGQQQLFLNLIPITLTPDYMDEISRNAKVFTVRCNNITFHPQLAVKLSTLILISSSVSTTNSIFTVETLILQMSILSLNSNAALQAKKIVLDRSSIISSDGSLSAII